MNELDVYTAPKKARVEIIPLIDVVFFLLATFVLFTLSLDKLSVLGVPLPKTGKQTDNDTMLFIQASETGTLYWKIGTRSAAIPIATEELRGRLEDYRRSVSEPRVFVRSDGKAKLGDAVLVLDEVRRAGITQVSVETMVSPPGS